MADKSNFLFFLNAFNGAGNFVCTFDANRRKHLSFSGEKSKLSGMQLGAKCCSLHSEVKHMPEMFIKSL